MRGAWHAFITQIGGRFDNFETIKLTSIELEAYSIICNFSPQR